MKYLLFLFTLFSFTMCSEKDSNVEARPKTIETQKSTVKVTLGADIADDYVRNGCQVIEIETPVSIKDLIEKFKINLKTLGDYYSVGEDAHFVFVVESGKKREWLYRIEKKNGFHPYQNRLIDLKNGDKLTILQLSR